MGRLNDEHGVVLAQVMVMSIILATIATMLIQWQYGRYILAYRMETSTRGRALVESALYKMLSDWETFSTPPTVVNPITINDPILGGSAGNVTVFVNDPGNSCMPDAPYTVKICLSTTEY